MIALQVLSGPVGLLTELLELQYLGYLRFSPLLKYLKIFTINKIFNVFYATYFYSDYTIPPLILMITNMFQCSMYSYGFHDHFSLLGQFNTFQYSTVVYFQIITYDNWSYGLTYPLFVHGEYVNGILCVAYAVISNYLFLCLYTAHTTNLFSGFVMSGFQFKNLQECPLYKQHDRYFINLKCNSNQ